MRKSHDSVSNVKGIRYYSLLGSCGYGDAALTYMKALIEQGVPLRWSPLVNTKWGMAPRHMLPAEKRPEVGDVQTGIYKSVELLQCLEKDIEYDTVLIHCMPELWPKLVEKYKVNIGYTVWETDRLPAHWPELLHSVDHICVPCQFNRDIFSIEQGPGVSVVPHALKKKLSSCAKQDQQAFRREHEIAESTYIFYIIAAWDPRKSMFETLHAFLLEFDAGDDVCFLIKTDGDGATESSGRRRSVRAMVNEIIGQYQNSAKVVLISDRIPEREIQIIHKIGDCFFSLTHAEGWGIGAFDAAALGNPVIITGWGGQLDYLPEEYSYQVKFTLKSIQELAHWESYDGSQKWAFADINDACSLLRNIYQNQNEAKEKGVQLQKFVKSKFSIEQVSVELNDAIHEAHS